MSDRNSSRPSIFEDPEAYFEAFQQRNRAMQERAQDLQAAMAEAHATAESPDSEVSVTVNVSGGLEDIRFTPEVRRMAAETLRQTVLETYRNAMQQAVQNLDSVMESVLGADSETMSVYRNATRLNER
ncbi:YbaB/EbfC family nucleoid-associated protein [Glycomyces sp. L485]|uniref:YbaB/EbfC family nucleoid-associated protein n=1 Tax=Glycomyces sp. L485 TaxID=2909235 RepID=UPI001F4B6593|nr:YbaB/EbfC family nucleoid-associated protein [Glycomyces sp. L485]MCH7229350.1 YbaB/EbfC family nucleoid-associated protein [Glycomyces sp. L485]